MKIYQNNHQNVVKYKLHSNLAKPEKVLYRLGFKNNHWKILIIIRLVYAKIVWTKFIKRFMLSSLQHNMYIYVYKNLTNITTLHVYC